jgi:hypothetical protein
MYPPIVVPSFTSEVAAEVASIAQTLPYRSELGVDPERVFWVIVNEVERIGVAWAPDHPDGPCWMIAVAFVDGRRVLRGRVREIVEFVAGRSARFELAPLFEPAPQMTMARIPVRRPR